MQPSTAKLVQMLLKAMKQTITGMFQVLKTHIKIHRFLAIYIMQSKTFRSTTVASFHNLSVKEPVLRTFAEEL